MLESLSYLHDIIYHTDLLRERLFHLYGWAGGGEGGGRFPTKKLGPIFSETNIQDGVNSIVHFLKRQHRVSGEKKSRLENILYFLLLNLLCRGS